MKYAVSFFSPAPFWAAVRGRGRHRVRFLPEWHDLFGLRDSASRHPKPFRRRHLLGDEFSDYVSAEFRYLYHDGHPFLEAPGVKTDIQGQSDALTIELLFHFKPREHRLRPFLAGGAGAKEYIIAGPAPFPQPIPQIASLTTNDVWKVVFSVGGGVKYRLRPHVLLRAEFGTISRRFPGSRSFPPRTIQRAEFSSKSLRYSASATLLIGLDAGRKAGVEPHAGASPPFGLQRSILSLQSTSSSAREGFVYEAKVVSGPSRLRPPLALRSRESLKRPCRKPESRGCAFTSRPISISFSTRATCW